MKSEKENGIKRRKRRGRRKDSTHLQGLEIVANHPQLLLQLHDLQNGRLITRYQCSGSVRFLYGSRSSDLCPDFPDPDPTHPPAMVKKKKKDFFKD
jgi:hypothetical protein